MKYSEFHTFPDTPHINYRVRELHRVPLRTRLEIEVNSMDREIRYLEEKFRESQDLGKTDRNFQKEIKQSKSARTKFLKALATECDLHLNMINFDWDLIITSHRVNNGDLGSYGNACTVPKKFTPTFQNQNMHLASEKTWRHTLQRRINLLDLTLWSGLWCVCFFQLHVTYEVLNPTQLSKVKAYRQSLLKLLKETPEETLESQSRCYKVKNPVIEKEYKRLAEVFFHND